MSEPTTDAGLLERIADLFRAKDGKAPEWTRAARSAEAIADQVMAVAAEVAKTACPVCGPGEECDEVPELAMELAEERCAHQATIVERDRLAAEVETLRSKLARAEQGRRNLRGLLEHHRDVGSFGELRQCRNRLERALRACARYRAEVEQLRTVSRGYCPECGRGDCAPTVEDWQRERNRAEKAEAKLARVQAECDRIEAAVRDNPTTPDLAGGYLACIRWIRTALDGTGEA